MIIELEETERFLIAAGAKPFYELHKEIKKSENNSGFQYTPPTPTPYKTSWSFSSPDMNDVKKDGYIKLFEAAWTGDLDMVKAMTLQPWAMAKEPPSNTPLQIAVKDSNGFSPFSIAVLKGHRDLARRIFEIALAQYSKDDIKGQRKRWRMVTEKDEDLDASEDEDEHVLPIFADLVNDTFTVDNLGAVSGVVKSNVLPSTMINWTCDVARFDTTDVYEYRGQSLLEHAVESDNLGLLKFLVEVGTEQQKLLAEEDDDQRCFTIEADVFKSAIRLGRISMLAELIEASGVGIPLNEMIKKSGIELKTKPRYYQGLTVGGKKRADWAQPPDMYEARVVEEKIPPLLQAAHLGNIESVEWFMSDAPMRRYNKFAEANKDDKRIKTLESGKGFEQTIAKWMRSRSMCPRVTPRRCD